MANPFELDFKELSQNDRPGFKFQALIADIGQVLGYEVTEEGGTGADRGRDLFFQVPYSGIYGKTETKKWLVSCKDNCLSGKAVKRSELTTGQIDSAGFNCYGYLLACSTYVGNDVVEMLHGWETHSSSRIYTCVWNKQTIHKILFERENDFRLTLSRFFPVSYGRSNSASDHVTIALLTFLKQAPFDEAVWHATAISETDDDTLQLWRIAAVILERQPDLPRLAELLKVWSKDNRLSFRTALGAKLVEYINNRPDYLKEVAGTLQSLLPDTPPLKPHSLEIHVHSIELEDEESEFLIRCAGEAAAEFDSNSCLTRVQVCAFTFRIAEGAYNIQDVSLANQS